MVEEHVEGAVNRSDVALQILKALEDDTAIGKDYNVVDANKPSAFEDY